MPALCTVFYHKFDLFGKLVRSSPTLGTWMLTLVCSVMSNRSALVLASLKIHLLLRIEKFFPKKCKIES
jgi:hypothetical protein